ncbi:hypothetical protein GCM10009678_74740 [Actinomadura kijaniata]|uniref:DDE Tnp4 domain-containing protein n=1 Tax=Actinomadura namibiensis TaxID=182080 RepID=A0A7W3M041_ACTNM|nr:transposase family protein [Actinomadura namibiensis]MBA8957392.1 hypothetical protein [Actinomadura namibiensis]
MLFYRAALDLSPSARTFVADLIRDHRRRTGSRWRRLAPDLRQALRTARGKAFLVLEGTLAAIDRLSGANDRLYYPGKHRRHGVNIQFLTDPHGELIWASPALPDPVHDLTAARQHGIIDHLAFCAIACYADKGYVGAGGAIGTPLQAQEAPQDGETQKGCSTGTTPRPAAHPAARPPSSKQSSPSNTRADEDGITSVLDQAADRNSSDMPGCRETLCQGDADVNQG